MKIIRFDAMIRIRREPDDEVLAAVEKLGVASHDQHGRTPLFFAVAAGRHSLCQGLLALGAAVNLQDDEGLTPLHFAVQWGMEDIVRLLLAAGADVDTVDIHGNTALWYSMSCGGSQETFLNLIAAGASAHIRNRFGKTVYEVVAETTNQQWRAAVGLVR